MIEGITPVKRQVVFNFAINVFSLRIADISMILARYCIYMHIAYALILHVETTLNVFNSVLVFLWVLGKRYYIINF